jgi:hypothetical protein
MKPSINPTLTQARLSVLKQVRDHPGHWASGFGVAVIHCWKLGWIDAAKNGQGQMIGHQITVAGKAILTQHELIAFALSYTNKTLISDKIFAEPVASMQRSGIEGSQHA